MKYYVREYFRGVFERQYGPFTERSLAEAKKRELEEEPGVEGIILADRDE